MILLQRGIGFLDADFRFQISVFKIEGVCGAEKSVPDKKEINIYIYINKII